MKLINIILTEIFRPFIKRVPVDLPSVYGEFKLVKDLKPGAHFPYAVGLYSTSNGQKVVGKFWTGKFRDVYYYLLSHEIVVLRVLNSIESRNRIKLKKFPVEFAQLIKSYEDKNKIVVFTKFSPGIQLIDSAPKIQLGYHQSARTYILEVGKLANKAEIRQISIKNAPIFTYQFPLLILASTVRQPWLLKSVFKNIWIFIQGLPLLYAYKDEYVLTHGDLHGKNVLIAKDRATILDVEQAVFTYSDYELINCMSSPYFGSSLKADLRKRIILDAKKTHSDLLRTKALLMNYAIHCLTGELNSEHVLRYQNLINFAVSLK